MVAPKKKNVTPEQALQVPREVKLTYIEQMEPDVCYVIETAYPTMKRTTTGYYVTHSDEQVTLLDQKGRFKHVDIDRIIRINFYQEGRAPFERN